MGIHGLLRELGPPPRISLAKLSADHYATHSRPLILAIDISIWLFQIQSGKGGSNPALRTFYYRLLRLLTLNIWPLFVFDGPNKPLFKRNKKVGGPGVRVATVPEFLAKQLLKEFGFPWHIAPGEAEAECALLQREGVVDAVLSEDVDTLMFGSGVTFRSWSAEGSTTKSPTHVSVYREEETKQRSRGLDRDGMILVALMSGGDYLPEGIPGCGPKVACDAARAGFGKELCALGAKDTAGLRLWRERLQHQIRTNEAKYFSRKNGSFTMPEKFPNLEVLGYYTHPCVSKQDKVQKLRDGLKWDQDIDFAALRTFTTDAFDWRFRNGAKKFIKNLAPAMLTRQLRMTTDQPTPEAQAEAEGKLVKAVHGRRNHNSTDGTLEYRVSFIPARLVPIDLSMEEEEDEIRPADPDRDAESELDDDFTSIPLSVASGDETESGAPASPTKKRQYRPYDPAAPEKAWIIRSFLQVGCPLLVEEYEASFRDPKQFLKQRHKAKAVKAGSGNLRTKAKQKKNAITDMPHNALMAFANITKAVCIIEPRDPLKDGMSQGNTQPRAEEMASEAASGFKMPSRQISARLLTHAKADLPVEQPYGTEDLSDTPRPFAGFAVKRTVAARSPKGTVPRAKDPRATPTRRKRPSLDLSSPATSQRTIASYYSPSPHKEQRQQKRESNFISLISSSPARPVTTSTWIPSPPNLRHEFVRSPSPVQPAIIALRNQSDIYDFSPGKLPDSVTKRRKKGPFKRHQTAPVLGADDVLEEIVLLPTTGLRSVTPELFGEIHTVEAMDLASPSPARRSGGFLLESDANLPSPNLLFEGRGDRLTRPAAASRDVEERPPSANETPASIDEDKARKTIPPYRRVTAQGQPTSIVTCTSKKHPTPRSPSVSIAPRSLRRSPRQAQKKKAILLRQSLEGAWREIDAETLDMSGDGSGWKPSKGRADIVGVDGKARAYRKSGVDVLDLTGA
ncbi:hypothetical protein BAUCODRAFT_29098 [Baudoinia panamericana UAMH 10762]|uniref:XPG-I domain-containing protein n=1 Tax=Baudoinia panamericana (strain UAMH 10762) TaxID=717646 RepID=M2N996_BAUPA|nr:uncharacterized protein BAUCODRAFT_29098 [Baudoinia panamericana UAMH 10762]EMD00744.1 hypothetical protein BAUCODRAFT_29098 [Baudoinia panamericana UAMH 10762]